MAQQGAVLEPTRLIQLAVVSALYALLILVARGNIRIERRAGIEALSQLLGGQDMV